MSKVLDLIATSLTSFKIGITNAVTLKNSAGTVQIRNSADSADAALQALQVINTGNTMLIGTTNVLTVSKNTAQAGGLTVIWPAAKATDGQVLAQKAGTPAGVIEFEFVSAANTSTCMTTDTTSLGFGSSATVAMFTLPANAVVEAVRVIIDTAFNGTPSMSVGISGTTSKYLSSTQVDLTAAAQTVFETYPGRAAVGTTEALQISYTSGGATAGAARVEVDYVVPA